MKRKKVMSAALAGALVITMMVPPHGIRCKVRKSGRTGR